MRYQVHAALLFILAAGPAGAVIPAVHGKLPPLISTTARDAECGAAELRLARFIRALQLDHRVDAAQFFSIRVSPEERQQFVEGQWPGRAIGRNNDVSAVLFQKDLQIRTRNRFTDALRMEVAPRKLPKRTEKRPVGWLPVMMRREHGEWFLDLHPLKADVPLHITHMGKGKKRAAAPVKPEKPAPK